VVDAGSGYCSVAFKEWAGVCSALADGRQSIILRKGGIREEPGPGAFVPEHSEFWLYPTAVHQAQQGLRIAEESRAAAPLLAGSTIAISGLARVELIARVQDESMLVKLEEFHVLTPETLRARFQYRSPGLWVLGTRIWLRERSLELAATPEYAGCKTWVTLDEPLPTSDLHPALDDTEWARRLARLRTILAHDHPQRRH
jgi:hypothetical protein